MDPPAVDTIPGDMDSFPALGWDSDSPSYLSRQFLMRLAHSTSGTSLGYSCRVLVDLEADGMFEIKPKITILDFINAVAYMNWSELLTIQYPVYMNKSSTLRSLITFTLLSNNMILIC